MVGDEVLAFWDLFRRRANDLAAATSADNPTYDELLAQLHRIDPGLSLEFSPRHGMAELIVTAQGDRSLFEKARAVAAHAPSISGWSIRALKPKLGFPESVRWHGLTIHVADLRFLPLRRAGADDLGIRVLVPDIAAEDVNDARNAVVRAIDYGLGEERFATSIAYLDVRPLADDDRREELLRLEELDEYLQFLERQRDNSPT